VIPLTGSLPAASYSPRGRAAGRAGDRARQRLVIVQGASSTGVLPQVV